MHQSDLYLPVPPVTSRFAPAVRLPAPASSSTSALPQSISNSTTIPKKRNVERACDGCRRRKTRCDGPKMPDNVCTNCVQNRKICTYIEASKPRGPSKAYITGLEDRVERMEALLKRLRPETDFSAELGPPVVRGAWKNEFDLSTSPPTGGKTTGSRSLHQFHSLSTLLPPALSRKSSVASISVMSDHGGNIPSDDAEEDPILKVIQKTQRLTLFDKQPQDKANRVLDTAVRFHGKSTNFNLVLATREMRMLYLRESTGAAADIVNDNVGGATHPPDSDQVTRAMSVSSRRQEYWRAPECEQVYEGEFLLSETLLELLQNWPPSDLVPALIDLYFLHCNSMFPLLHRPTFARHFGDGLYEHNIWFACLCMSVFALASRYTDDLRVLLDVSVETPAGEHSEQSRWQTAGFRYYFSNLEVENKQRISLNPASLFEIQTLCLMTQFQSETRWHRGAWHIIGTGIRKMQDIGAHSKQSYAMEGPTVENELWKRVWWYLIGVDRMQCAILGRPCAAKEEDFNAEYPLEVDDDFWENEDSQLAFRQPPEKPSNVTAFNLWLRLTDFTASALHCFDIVEHDGPSSVLRAEDVLNQLNENLTEWAKNVPQHLRWSPDIEDVTLANQSATLYTTYNIVTILLQRAFLPSSVGLLCSSNIASSQPGLAQAMTARAISINAAKAVARILAVVHKHALSNVPLLLTGAEITVAVLCIDWWIIKARDGKFSPSSIRTRESHMQDVKMLLTALRWAAPRWETAQERLECLEKMIPDLDKESENLDHVSTFDLIRERQQGHLDLPKPQQSIGTSSRPDFSYSRFHASSETMGMSIRHARGRGEEPWLADLSRQYNSPQHSSAHPTPRISSYSLLPRIRASNSTDHSRRPFDEWAIADKSYPTPSLLPTLGYPHATPTPDPDNSPQFPYVKHEPDNDLITPPPRLGWTYMGHQVAPIPAWEASDVPGSRYSASAARDGPGSSLLSHLQQRGRDPTTHTEHVSTS